MNCPNCGKENAAGAKFCESCGAPLNFDAQVSDAQAAPVPPAPPTAPGQQGACDPSQAAQPNGYYQPPQGQQTYAQPGYTQPNGYAQPGYGQPASPYAQAGYQPSYTEAIYPMTDTDRTLRLINFILCLLSTIVCALAIIPLCWMIPMTVISWGIYKGKKRNTVAFGVCTLIFVNVIGGILLLCSNKDL